MEAIISFLERYFVPVAARFGAQRHLVAVRDGFAGIMPLIIIGAMAILINSLPIPAYQDLMVNLFGKSWKSFGANLWTGSYAIMSLLIVITLSYRLARSYNSDGLAASVVSFSSLLILYAGSQKDFALPFAYLGAQGLFVAILVPLIATEIFVRLSGNPKLVINMPEGVPPAVAKSFSVLIPSMVVITIFGLVRCATDAIGISDIHAAIYQMVQAPISGLAQDLKSILLISFLLHIFWFFGLHGGNIMVPIVNTVYLPALNDNIAAFQAGQYVPNIVTWASIDAFVHMGGAGATICFVIAMVIAAKRKQNQEMIRLSGAPSVFNINEPLLFGMPFVLNPLYLIPFVLTPMVLTLITYFATAAGFVPKAVSMVPWTTPPIISGFLVTGGSIAGAVLSVVNLAIGVVMYIPFIILAERYENKRDQGNTATQLPIGKTRGA